MSKRKNRASKPDEWAAICEGLLKQWGRGITDDYRMRLERLRDEAIGETQRYGKADSVIHSVKAANE